METNGFGRNEIYIIPGTLLINEMNTKEKLFSIINLICFWLKFKKPYTYTYTYENFCLNFLLFLMIFNKTLFT